MFWTICVAVFVVAVLVGACWGHKEFNSISAGILICGVTTIGILWIAFLLVASYGPKEGANSMDYTIENVGGDMYYVDENGSHNISSKDYTTRFSDVEHPTYRIITYSWENWPAFPDAELLIPKKESVDG